MSERTTFVSGLGQIDNVGDTVLRRAYISALRTAGNVCVFVGNRDSGYISGLGLGDQDVTISSGKEWRKALSRALSSGHEAYGFSAGEIQIDRTYAVNYLKIWPLLLVSRMRGGKLLHLGMGIRSGSAWSIAIRGVLRACNLVTWRDPWSQKVMKIGTVAPDWAFAEGSTAETIGNDSNARQYLAISLRHDRPYPSAEWIAAVRETSERLNLKLIVVTQIKRDASYAVPLATALEAEVMLWNSDDHLEQERELRRIYSQSAVVLTERLHAAVIGLTEGAPTVVLSSGQNDKVVRSLMAVGILAPVVPRETSSALQLFEATRSAVANRRHHVEGVIRARSELAAITSKIGDIIR